MNESLANWSGSTVVAASQTLSHRWPRVNLPIRAQQRTMPFKPSQFVDYGCLAFILGLVTSAKRPTDRGKRNRCCMPDRLNHDVVAVQCLLYYTSVSGNPDLVRHAGSRQLVLITWLSVLPQQGRTQGRTQARTRGRTRVGFLGVVCHIFATPVTWTVAKA